MLCRARRLTAREARNYFRLAGYPQNRSDLL